MQESFYKSELAEPTGTLEMANHPLKWFIPFLRV